MLKIFSGTSNQILADKVAKSLKIPLAKSEVVRFDNSEVRVRICEDVKNDTCVVLQPFANPTDTSIMEFFFFCDALRRQEAHRVIGFIPYFGYARQDIQHRPGECVSANVLIRFLESIGLNKVYALDLHDEATEGVFSIPFKNLSALPLLAESVKIFIANSEGRTSQVSEDFLGGSQGQYVIVSPDQGGIERARKFGESFYGNSNFELAVIEKRRNQEIKHQTQALGLYGDIKGKIAIIADDMTTSGGTLINAARLCKEKGAQKVIAVIVHHDFSDYAPQKIQNSDIDVFFTTNSILLKDSHRFAKLQEIDISPLISEELKTLL